ncbi:hypothetical protein Scep_004765 [Stephania cephalantha]|uniref:Uncharacterized protein n=1 Tax=Stephania cephalantha TaxID=152367 RepID=A0AAP0KT98_9MAGN
MRHRAVHRVATAAVAVAQPSPARRRLPAAAAVPRRRRAAESPPAPLLHPRLIRSSASRSSRRHTAAAAGTLAVRAAPIGRVTAAPLHCWPAAASRRRSRRRWPPPDLEPLIHASASCCPRHVAAGQPAVRTTPLPASPSSSPAGAPAFGPPILRLWGHA